MLNNRRVYFSSISLFLSKVVSVLSNLLIIRFLKKNLSPEEFGLWAVIISLMMFFTSPGGIDFGLGHALRNKLASLFADTSQESQSQQKKIFFSGFYTLFLITFIGVVLLLVVDFPWDQFFKIGDPSLKYSIHHLMRNVGIMLFVSIPFVLNISGFLAYQEAFWRSAIDILFSLSTLFIVYLFTSKGVSFSVLMFSYFALNSLMSFLSFMIFLKARGWSWVLVSFKTQFEILKPLLKQSGGFWLLNLSGIVIFSTGSFLVSQVSNLTEAGEFSLLQKLFVLLLTTHATLLMPFWSAYTHAAADNDWVRVKKYLRQSVLITLGIFIFGGVFLIVFHNFLLMLWVGYKIHHLSLLISLSIWALFYGLSSCFSIFLNGLNVIKMQVKLGIVAAILNVVLSFILGKYWGALGVVMASIISILPLLISNPIQAYQLLKQKNNATPIVNLHSHV